ncbi:LytTR family DNA-binding domain-containing protein [Paraphotobacterium marinum]|nr:LytTR family DNA-binding domain-containing protein [Paraphotobacterium marinum]
MLKISNKRYSSESLIYLSVFLYILVFSIGDSITVDIYPAETILKGLIDKENNITSSLFWLGIIKTSIRVVTVFLFMYLIKKKQSKFNLKLFHLILFFVFLFLCFYGIFILLMINGYILYVYSFHQGLIDAYYTNTFIFWKSAFLYLLNYKNIGYLVIVNNIFSIFVFYIAFLKFSNDKNFSIITNKMITQLNELISNKLTLRQVSEINAGKYNHDITTSEFDNLYDSSKNKVSTFIVEKSGEEHLISVEEVIVIQSDGNYIDIVTNKCTFEYRSTLTDILENLPEYFIRIHRSTIINLKKVEGVKTDYVTQNLKLQVMLKNKKLYVVSKRYRNIFKERWKSYVSLKES